MDSTQGTADKAADTIHYHVNAEDHETTERHLTGREILVKAGFEPPEDYRLTRDPGGKEIGLDDRESIHKGERFLATYRATTPVS